MPDRAQDQHPENLWFSRLAALEEAMKYQASTVADLRTRLDRQPEELRREFPTHLELERSYVKRGELRAQARDRLDIWGIRLVAAGILASNIIALVGLIHSLH